MSAPGGWIGVDLDGTLARYDGWKGATHIGEPVADMRKRVLAWLAEGKTVKIFTARVWCPTIHTGGATEEEVARWREAREAREAIERWCEYHLGRVLPVTCTKDFGMIELWDDRAFRVIANTGQLCCQSNAI